MVHHMRSLRCLLICSTVNSMLAGGVESELARGEQRDERTLTCPAGLAHAHERKRGGRAHWTKRAVRSQAEAVRPTGRVDGVQARERRLGEA